MYYVYKVYHTARTNNMNWISFTRLMLYIVTVSVESFMLL